MFKSVPSTVIAIAVLLWMPTSGFAGVIQSNGFVGYYSLTPKDGNPYGNWTLEGDGDFGVEVIDGGSRLRLRVGPSSNLEFSILIPADGHIWFSWSSEPVEDENSFTYSLGGIHALMPQSPNISVMADQTFTLGLFDAFVSEDQELVVTMENFSGPYVIPEPSTFGLLTLAFAGLGLRLLWRRRKRGRRF